MTKQQEITAAEPPLGSRVEQRIERYLRQLAPHQNEREGPTLMREALVELKHLREWIKIEADANDTCTRYILGEICDGCRCGKRSPIRNFE